MAVPITVGTNLGGEFDIHLRYILPFIAPALAVVSFIRREPTIWGILGIILTAVYVELHCIAIP
jgi:hypothetical protein